MYYPIHIDRWPIFRMHINYDTNTTYLLYWLTWILLSASTRPPYGRVVIVLSDPNAFESEDDILWDSYLPWTPLVQTRRPCVRRVHFTCHSKYYAGLSERLSLNTEQLPIIAITTWLPVPNTHYKYTLISCAHAFICSHIVI